MWIVCKEEGRKPHNAANAMRILGKGVPPIRRRWYFGAGRRYVPIGFNTNHRCIWRHSLTIICDASFNYKLWGKGRSWGLKMGSLSSPVVTSYRLPIGLSVTVFAVLRLVTDRRNWSSKRWQFYWPPNS